MDNNHVPRGCSVKTVSEVWEPNIRIRFVDCYVRPDEFIEGSMTSFYGSYGLMVVFGGCYVFNY